MRKIKIIFLLLACVMGMNAQDIPSPEESAKKKEINQIKLSEEAVYADVMQEAASPEEAIELSKTRTFTMLQTHVVEAVVKDMNMSREDAKSLWSELEGKCRYIVVSQMGMYRVFSYIMRADLLSGVAPAEQPTEALADVAMPQNDTIQAQPVQAAPVQVVDSTALVQVQPVSPDAQPVDSTAVVVPTEQPVQEVPVQVVDSTALAQAQPVAPVIQPVDSTTVVVPAVQPVQPVQAAPVVVAQPVQPVQPTKEPEPEPEVVEVEVPALCQTMIDKKNMSDLMRYLNQEKNYQRLMYGNSNTMQYPEKCYIVIIDKETREIVSVLDKGQRERMNFITKEMDRYSKYRRGNYAAVFVQEY